MDITTIVSAMYPCWILGALVLWATAKSKYKDTIRIEKPAIVSWIKILGVLTLYRAVVFTLFPHPFQGAAEAITSIPWPLTLTVFWEDACHGLPLLLLRNAIGVDKWWKWFIHVPITAFVMYRFGCGHVYQGIPAALFISLYVPYSIRLGRKFGFGTVMVGHTMYDLTTIVSLKILMGL